MCFVIFSENFMKLLAWFVAVSLAGLLSHFNSTIRHKCTFQRFVCLKTNYLLQIFHAVIDICCAVSCDFIQNNYTPYDGDEKFLEGPTEATDRLWGKLQELQKEERAKGGVLDMETDVVSGITAYGAAYIDDSISGV